MLRVAIVTLLVSVLSPATAADHQHPGGAAHEELGSVEFETSCAPRVRESFNRSIALLHSFEFGPAIDGFNTTLDQDPSCAIAHWGIALSHWGNPFGATRSTAALEQGAAAIESGRALGAGSARERAYLDAAASLFANFPTVSQRDRIVAYAKAMERVSRDYPDDTEAQIFYALAVNQTALPTDKTYAPQLKAAGILEPLVESHPDHPGLTHYIIHAYDHPPLAARALDAARRYAEIAPSAPHALHMPSHTFTRVGSWEESAATNRRSEQTAIEQGSTTQALHAMDYQVYAYLQMAQYRNARAVLERLPGVLANFDPQGLQEAAPPTTGYFAMAAIPARYALERGAWDEAASIAVPEVGTPFTVAIAHFTRALGAARSGHPDAAGVELERLAVLRDRLQAEQSEYWAEQVDIQRRVAAAWVTFAGGREADGIRLLSAAAEAEDATDKSAVTPGPLVPARELLGYMLLEAGDPAAALLHFEKSMDKEPRRFRGAYGAAQAAEAAGKRETAGRYFQLLLEIAGDADSQSPELDYAHQYVAASR